MTSSFQMLHVTFTYIHRGACQRFTEGLNHSRSCWPDMLFVYNFYSFGFVFELYFLWWNLILKTLLCRRSLPSTFTSPIRFQSVLKGATSPWRHYDVTRTSHDDDDGVAELVQREKTFLQEVHDNKMTIYSTKTWLRLRLISEQNVTYN